jgi:hypothetical protein
MTLADLKDDGDFKLVIADTNSKLKIYMGTNIICNLELHDLPVAIETFYDSTKKPSNSQFIHLINEYSVAVYSSCVGERHILFLELLASHEV